MVYRCRLETPFACNSVPRQAQLIEYQRQQNNVRQLRIINPYVYTYEKAADCCQRLFQFLMYMMTDKIIVSEKNYHICQHCRNHQIMSTIKADRFVSERDIYQPICQPQSLIHQPFSLIHQPFSLIHQLFSCTCSYAHSISRTASRGRSRA